MPDNSEAHRLLRLYLRDHDGASAGGVRLVERSHRSNEGTAFEAGFAALRTAIGQDQAELRMILQQLRIRPSRPRRVIAWCAATAGVLKLNGHLLTYSPLSRVVEIEALSAAVTAKLGLWNTLIDLSASEPRLELEALTRLQRRAVSHLETLASMHRDAARIAFEGPDARSRFQQEAKRVDVSH